MHNFSDIKNEFYSAVKNTCIPYCKKNCYSVWDKFDTLVHFYLLNSEHFNEKIVIITKDIYFLNE